ncbi:MAG: SurA N-terminal domain-containing protein [Rhizomicrobium sp.]
MRKLPKNRFFLRILLAVLPGAGLLALGTLPIGAQTQHRPHASAKPAAPAPAQNAAPAAPADTSDDDDINSNGVAAVINDQIVSEYDVRQRLALVLSTSGMAPTPDTLKKLRPQVLDQLKTEKLELEEAQRKNITVSPTEVDKEIENILKDNHLTKEQLTGILAKSGVAFETLRAQIAVQLAWQKSIEDEYGDRVNITDADVTDELTRINQGKDKPHYLVGEIFLPSKIPNRKTRSARAPTIWTHSFRTARRLPPWRGNSAKARLPQNGGDIGWVNDGQLAPELNAALGKMQIESVSQPLRATGGLLHSGSAPASGARRDQNCPIRQRCRSRIGPAICRSRACCCRCRPRRRNPISMARPKPRCRYTITSQLRAA